ncbi:MAG: biopolymer transporter ExbD [Gammaproteobacteria bacterium]|nr:biopolymer transporter ExbD [Gammaproteobacteria bacterium]
MNLRRHDRSRDLPELNLVSLVDVVLLLLIFFVLTTSFVAQSRLAIHLPEAASTAADAVAPALEITVTARGGFFVNGRALVDNRPETLVAAIRRISPDGELHAVTISADARAAHQDVVTAMDVAGRLGITDVHIATLRASPERAR